MYKVTHYVNKVYMVYALTELVSFRVCRVSLSKRKDDDKFNDENDGKENIDR